MRDTRRVYKIDKKYILIVNIRKNGVLYGGNEAR